MELFLLLEDMVKIDVGEFNIKVPTFTTTRVANLHTGLLYTVSSLDALYFQQWLSLFTDVL